MSKIDWSQAPEGTTHHCRTPSGGELWYRATPFSICYSNPMAKDDGWCTSSYKSVSGLYSSVARTITARPEPVEPQHCYLNAAGYCEAAKGHMLDRASTYDAPAGERSMAKTVTAFNALTGHQLTEEQGWLFMETLKMARSQQGQFRQDNYEDAVAYAALRGEAAGRERKHDQT